MVVKRVVPGSPAEAAGMKPGDALVALNGTPLGEKSEAAKKAAQKAMVPGGKVTYTVLRDGKERPVEVTLGKLPREVLAQWVGAHMLESHVRSADE